MLLNRTIFIIVFSIFLNTLNAQDTTSLSSKDSIITQSWVLGLGYNIVDDSATPFGGNIFNINESWNSTYYPNSISLGKSFKNGLLIKTVASYNKYKIGKLVDGSINLQERDYLAIDVMLSYDLNALIGETGWLDPFVQIGGGYSNIGSLGRTTGNMGFGFNTWLNDNWGLNFNTMGKWGIGEGKTRQLQHSAGVVYRFKIEKGLTVKGIEKLALIEDLEKERIRKNDSIAIAKKEEESVQFVAEQLATKIENDRLAELEKERLNKKENLQQAIDELGNVYFDLNSSYLNKETSKILDKLVTLLENNKDLVLKISSFTDARGSDAYNQWLSERRVNTTLAYLIKNGIAKERLEAQAYGEHGLLNECDNHTSCPDKKHQLNRRSEFSIIHF